MSRPSSFTGPLSVVMLEDRPRSPMAKLTRFAPDRRDWENEFLSWWLETDYGQQLTNNGKYKFRWSVESRSLKVVELRSSRPKVVCRSYLTPLNHPYYLYHKSYGTSTMGKHLKSNLCRRSVEKAACASFSPTRSRFTKAQLEDQLLRTITSVNLSFELTEEPIFRELLDLVYGGPQVLDIPLLKQLRQHMYDMVTTYEESQLDSKVSLALCCWKSLLGQDFIAITAYYFDKKWSYREVLLGFELLCRPKTGTDPGDQILRLIINKGLLRRIFSVTIDYRVDEKLCFVGIPGTVQAIRLCLRRYIENITSSPEGEKVENVRAILYVNGWTDRLDGDEIIFDYLQNLLTRPLGSVTSSYVSSLYVFVFCQSENCPYKLTNADWRKVDYLVQLTMLFIQFTGALLASKEATVHKVCFVFKILMEYLDESTQILRRKLALWKRKLLEASLIMKMEFGEVYEKTFQNFGVIYGPGTFVAPQYKVSAFDEATSSQGLGRSERHIEYLRIFHL
ncbi:hypothetical protein N7527_006486 [Penicillium freii]|nr:hypothetical protein N7527_006486 [Penicillium freii]